MKFNVDRLVKARAGDELSVLTLVQPYASLVAAGFKHYNTTPHKPTFTGLALLRAGKQFNEARRTACLDGAWRTTLGLSVDRPQ